MRFRFGFFVLCFMANLVFGIFIFVLSDFETLTFLKGIMTKSKKALCES